LPVRVALHLVPQLGHTVNINYCCQQLEAESYLSIVLWEHASSHHRTSSVSWLLRGIAVPCNDATETQQDATVWPEPEPVLLTSRPSHRENSLSLRC
jgi:hypothetical protein